MRTDRAIRRGKRKKRRKCAKRDWWIIGPPSKQGCTVTGPMLSQLLEHNWVMP